MEIITGSKNEKIKNITALLSSKKERDKQGLFVIEGLRIFRDTLKTAPGFINDVFVSESFAVEHPCEEITEEYKKSVRLCKDLNPEKCVKGDRDDLRIHVVKDSVFDSISKTVTPQGILCTVKKPEHSLEEILTEKPGSDQAQGKGSGENDNSTKVLILENIQDPGNLGTMLRTAEAAGVSGIVMSRDCADIYNPKVIRSTMGSVFRVPFVYVKDFTEALRKIREHGITVYAAYLHGGQSVSGVQFDKKCAIMIGNEGNGLTDEAVSGADKRVFIPMAGQIESLNAAVAAAILLFHDMT